MLSRPVVAWAGLALVAYLLSAGAMLHGAAPVLRLPLQLATLALVWLAATSAVGRFHPISFYLPISSIYVLAAMLEVCWFGNRLDLEAERMAILADIGTGFLVACGAGVLAFRSWASGADSAQRTFPPHGLEPIDARMAVTACALLLGLSAALTLMRYGTSIGTISRADLYAEEFVLLSLVRGVLAVGLGAAAACIAAAEARHGSRLQPERLRLYGVLVAYMALDLLILGDRRLPMVALLGVAAVFVPRRLSWGQVLGAASLVALLMLYGLVRNTPPSEWAATLAEGEVLGALSPAANEFGGMAIIGGALDNLWVTPPGFPGYLDALPQLLPKALSPNRPQAPTEWFVWTYYPALAEIGASFAFNAVIEALCNGGWLGVLLVGFATGTTICFAAAATWRGAPLGLVLAMNVFTFSMRMDLASILRTAIAAAIGVALLLALAFGLKALLLKRPASSSARSPLPPQPAQGTRP